MCMRTLNLFKRRDKWFIVPVLLCWAWMNIWVALYYEPFRDVSQAWIITRYLNPLELLRQIKVEGHPFLWYLVLFPLAKLGAPFMSIIALSMTAMLLGLYGFLCLAPYGKLEKLAIVFSAAGMYHLPVIARGYALAPLMLMLVYLAYPKRYTRPMLYATALFFLCQLHVLLCGLAGMLMLEWTAGAFLGKGKDEASFARRMGAFAVMAAGVAVLALQLYGATGMNLNYHTQMISEFSTLPRRLIDAISASGQILTGVQVFETGNIIWRIVLIPAALALLGVGVAWIRRAPKSALMMAATLAWVLAVYALFYSLHTQHMLLFWWTAVFCVMMALDELKAKPAAGKPDVRLGRVLSAVVVAVCIMSFAGVYAAMRQECAPDGVNSEGMEAAAYIESELGDSSLVLIDNEMKAGLVAAFLPDGLLYDQIRHTDQVYSRHDLLAEGWISYGDLDEEVALLREAGVTKPLYLLADIFSEDKAQAMNDRSEAGLELVKRFDRAVNHENYLLYRIVEP